jgi:arylsulfatase A-like enzyme
MSAKPNLLIIHCDELNFRTLGCYRRTLADAQAFMWGPRGLIETPHIDSIADQGVICTKCYAATPVCTPSRGSFISGRYPQTTGVTTNNLALPDDVVSFAQVLRDNGYATGYAGKWHLDGPGKPQWAPQRDFGFDDNRFMFNRGHWKQLELTLAGPRVKARDADGEPTYSVDGADERSFTTDWLTDRTIDFIDAHHDSPFCYMVSIPDPHAPDLVRPPYDTLIDEAAVELPRTFDKPADGAPSWARPMSNRRNAMSQYLGMVKCIDDNVGRMLETLGRHGVLDQTIVVFTADHGDMCGEHGRQHKGVPLEASAKVPLAIRYPRKFEAGLRVDHVINTIDFLPTILALMGAATPSNVEGLDASALLMTGKPPTGWQDITFLRQTHEPGVDAGWVAAVTPRFKLVLSPGDEPWLLDLDRDPDELANAIDNVEHQPVVRELAGALRDYGQRYNDLFTQHPATNRMLTQLAGE